MKVAVCISGLPRWYVEHRNNIHEMLIEPNDADVFIHTWTSDPAVTQEITDIYNPVKIISEPQKKFKSSTIDLDRMLATHARSYVRENFIDMLYSSWYSVQASNSIKELYRLENDIQYDYVVRTRFDLHINNKVICKDHDSNIIHISCRDLPPEMVDDRFAFSSNENMNAYAAGFNMLDYVLAARNKKDGIFCGETLVYENLKMFGLKDQRVESLYCTQNTFK